MPGGDRPRAANHSKYVRPVSKAALSAILEKNSRLARSGTMQPSDARKKTPMFSRADRLPVIPPACDQPASPVTPQPWGASRMSPYANVAEFPEYTVIIDPDTQTGTYIDASGNMIDMRHRKTNRGTETEVTVQKGDGQGPSTYDKVPDQDTEED